jgi:2-polyprenyl-3-methyl-5-hydroxy-6-metoxy-1,4-benzoquinol methylase
MPIISHLDMNCNICNFEGKMTQYSVKEKMFGNFKDFTYLQCSNCKALILRDNITDYAPYYPNGYYSFQKKNKKDFFFRRYLKKIRLILFTKTFVKNIFPKNFIPSYFSWLTEIGLDFNEKVLEVGCGNGYQLFVLYNNGFNKLYGIDPFIERDFLDSNISIKKNEIYDCIEKNFDLIIFNHSLEHIQNHKLVLLKAKELLNKRGKILIRTPIIGRSFEIYKDNWVEIDAPRHLIIHSLNSIQILLQSINLKIYKVIFDTDEFEFWGSEQFCNNIPTNSQSSFSVNPAESMFSKKQIDCFKHLAHDYNKRQIAGRASFLIENLI